MEPDSSYYSKLNKKQTIVLCLLILLQIILNEIHLGTGLYETSFEYIPSVLIGYYFGPFRGSIAMIISTVVDLIFVHTSVLLFTIYTLFLVIAVIIYGLFLYHKEITFGRIFLMMLTKIIVVDVLLKTIWNSVEHKVPFSIMIQLRLPTIILSGVLQIIIVYVILRLIDKSSIRNKY